MSVARGSADGPKVVLERTPEFYHDLLREAVGEDADALRWGAALFLHEHGWSFSELERIFCRDRGHVCRQVHAVRERLLERFAA